MYMYMYMYCMLRTGIIPIATGQSCRRQHEKKSAERLSRAHPSATRWQRSALDVVRLSEYPIDLTLDRDTCHGHAYETLRRPSRARL